MKINQTYKLILKVAARNLWLFRLRTFIIGSLLGFGAFLAVLGLSLLRDVETSMRASITGSVVGDIQIHSSQAKDDLAVFGGGFMGRADIGTIPDLAAVRDVVMKVQNVDAMIPMGLDMVFLGRGNELDDTLEALRNALKSNDQIIVKDRVDQLKFQLSQLKSEIEQQRKLTTQTDELDEQWAAIAQAEAPDFLDTLTTVDESKLQFLDTKIAPISGEKTPVYLNYVGTDITLFQQKFPKFTVVEGEMIPNGNRGILISRKFREDFLKVMAARIFDRLNKRLTKGGMTISGDPENKRLAADLARQHAQVMAQLDRQEATELSQRLSEYGLEPENKDAELIDKLTSQLKSFLQVDDDKFTERYKLFYEEIAPRIKLYEISPGETITLRSYTKSGYIKSLPLKVYGVYTFTGLEDSDLAGAMNILDLVSFRELFGQMSEASKKELDDMRAAAGIKELDTANLEESLFGVNAAPVESTNTTAAVGAAPTIEVKPVIDETFDLRENDSGLALNAAIILKDPRKLRRTIKDLEKTFKQNNMDLKVVDWQTAAGIAGQFVVFVRMALIFSLIVIFIVALVIINNSIVVGTLNRTREIGTMRAIGAQKSFVVGLFLAETGLTGLLGSIFGSIVALMILFWLSIKGIPAANDVVSFLFSGPRLYPKMRWDIGITAPIVVTIIAVVASIYAARHAAQIQPAEAMQEKE